MDNTKPKKHFSIIDAIIIIVVIALLVGVALRYNVAGKFTEKSKNGKVIISFCINEVKKSQADAIADDELFYISSNSMLLGKISGKVSTSPTPKYQPDSQGKIVVSNSLEKVDIRGEIEAEGNTTEDGFMLNGTFYVGPNQNVEIKTKHITATLLVTGIRTVE